MFSQLYYFFGFLADFIINVGYYDEYNTTALGSFANLGHALYAYDIDGDHFNDLIIGCPFACDISFACNLSCTVIFFKKKTKK
jgi:hypothetical protein